MPVPREELNIVIVQELLANVSDSEIRDLCIEALRNWRQKHPDDNEFSMHGALGLELVPLLFAHKKKRAPMDIDTLSGLKEPFITEQTKPWFTGVTDFLSWFVRSGFGDVIAWEKKNVISVRLSRLGLQFLDAAQVPSGSGQESAPLEHARSILHECGWVLPRDATPLAQGGGGAVYKCYRRSLIEAVTRSRDPLSDGSLLVEEILAAGPEASCAALKIAHRFDERLAREIAAMQRVEDKHLVRVLARDERPQPVWFLMEFVGGGTLNGKLSDYHGNAAKTLHSILPVAKVLGRLHHDNLVHRDVKTKNIFLRHNGDLVLGDLGIVFDPQAARLTTYESPMSRDWTPRWRPEELDTPARDVYSMARVIYAMLTGDKLVEPEWLSDPDHQLTSMFPDDPAMPIVDDLLRNHITSRKARCASENGAAFAAAVEAALETVLVGRQMMPIVLWGSGASSLGSGPNKSLDGLPIMIPPWARRLTARLRYRHAPQPKVECTFLILLEDGKTKLESSPVSMTPHVWAGTSIDIPKRAANDWCEFWLHSDYASLISEFSLYALSY